jgi:TPP-dependent pyruvate/acetoin dehydrogenase alpha subunit
MRMKGHAIHDGADYVPQSMFEYWRKRDPIRRFENYLTRVKKWLTAKQNADLIAGVEREIDEEREIAVNSRMPAPETALGGVYCEDGCHEIRPKYGMPIPYLCISIRRTSKIGHAQLDRSSAGQ